MFDDYNNQPVTYVPWETLVEIDGTFLFDPNDSMLNIMASVWSFMTWRNDELAYDALQAKWDMEFLRRDSLAEILDWWEAANAATTKREALVARVASGDVDWIFA